jgi:hypothetical protein
MTDHMKPMTKGWYIRQRVHRHNGLSGHVHMMKAQLVNILGTDSVTLDAKRIAHAMLGLADQLQDLIKERIDP